MRSMIDVTPAGGVLRATAALAALLLAAIAQGMLERTNLQAGPPDYLPLGLFAASCALAIVAVRKRWEHWIGERPMRIRAPSWPWLLACLPGVAALVVATAVSDPHTPARTTAAWWFPGVAVLFAIGALHAARTRTWRADSGPDWTRTQLALAIALLVVVAVAMRTAVGVENLPNFIDSDETNMWYSARAYFDEPFAWLRVYWVGNPMLALASTRIVQIFDESFWAARIGNVVLGTLSVVATFAAGRRLFGNLPALIAALLLAGAHTHVHWSRTLQPYVQTPLLAAVFLWLLIRVWTGGSLLSWVGAAFVLGIATLTYQSSLLFAPLFVVTVLGWAAIVRPGWRAFLLSTCFIGVVAILVMGPVLRGALAHAETTASRPSTLFLFSEANLKELGENRAAAIADHALRTVTMFNRGADGFGLYGALRPLVDAVTGALVPLAAALLLVRIATPAAWMCSAWWFTYLFVTVFLANHQPSFHRITTALVFVAFAVASASTQLLAAMRDGFRLGPRSVPVGSLAIAALAIFANADFYFRQYPTDRGMWHTMGLAWIECAYVSSHVVIEATALDGSEYVPIDNKARPLLCPGWEKAIIRITSVADLWDIERFTQADDVVLITPAAVAREHPGHPRGYRVVRYVVDDRIGAPERLPLAVIELRRENAS
jgi:4-amino-4-deoxy-L-arabinose transferase-like glycosyltransferase